MPLVAGLLLSACATLVRDLPVRSEVAGFGLDARFSVTHAGERHSGRLAWKHDAAGDELRIASPFGQTVAEIRVAGGRARLQTGDGAHYEADSADELMHEVLGYPLPVAGLADWVLARPHGPAQVGRDAAGRPQTIDEAGWRITYEYVDAAAEALPALLSIERDGGPQLRLRIEEWRQP